MLWTCDLQEMQEKSPSTKLEAIEVWPQGRGWLRAEHIWPSGQVFAGLRVCHSGR
jgi:hypothetical protein